MLCKLGHRESNSDSTRNHTALPQNGCPNSLRFRPNRSRFKRSLTPGPAAAETSLDHSPTGSQPSAFLDFRVNAR